MRAIGDVLGLTDVPDDILIRWFRGFSAYLVDFGRRTPGTAPGYQEPDVSSRSL
jgi:hypothetical protein